MDRNADSYKNLVRDPGRKLELSRLMSSGRVDSQFDSLFMLELSPSSLR